MSDRDTVNVSEGLNSVKTTVDYTAGKITNMFQKDLIVWKQLFERKEGYSIAEFQKDLIVWKPCNLMVLERLRTSVSEGLNSVETHRPIEDTQTPAPVSEGLNSVETAKGDEIINERIQVSEGLNSVETKDAGFYADSASQVSEGLNSVETKFIHFPHLLIL